VYKKSLLAEELGFNEKLSRHKSPEATIDVATLANSAKKTEIIKDPEVYFNKRLKQDSVTQLLIYFFGLLLFIDVLYLVAASIAILRV
jgi:hypothetical protein